MKDVLSSFHMSFASILAHAIKQQLSSMALWCAAYLPCCSCVICAPVIIASYPLIHRLAKVTKDSQGNWTSAYVLYILIHIVHILLPIGPPMLIKLNAFLCCNAVFFSFFFFLSRIVTVKAKSPGQRYPSDNLGLLTLCTEYSPQHSASVYSQHHWRRYCDG